MAECSEMEGTLASVSSDQELDHLLDMAEVGVKIQIGAWLQRSQWLDKSYWDFSKYFPESAEEMGEVVGLSRCVILFSSDRGMAWVSRGMSRGRSPRDIPRETHAMPRSDEKRIILFHLTWTKGLELMFYFSLVADFPRHTAPSYTDFPRRPC